MLKFESSFGITGLALAVYPLIGNFCSQRKNSMLVKSLYTYLSFLLAVFTLAVALQISSAQHLAAAELPNFADLVERNAPSIVEISTIRQMAVRSPVADSELEELLRRINPDQEPDLDIEGMPEQRRRAAVGSAS